MTNIGASRFRVLFLELAKASRKYDTKEQLIDQLEAQKLS